MDEQTDNLLIKAIANAFTKKTFWNIHEIDNINRNIYEQ